MYAIDEHDRVVPFDGVPKLDAVASPIVLAPPSAVVLVYVIATPPHEWDRVWVETRATEPKQLAVVKFPGASSHMLGLPNDEVLHGHPLSSRGLQAYSAQEVLNSSWVRGLERVNSVHDRHDRERFLKLRHFIFTFHDVTFECIASRFSSETSCHSAVDILLPLMKEAEL